MPSSREGLGAIPGVRVGHAESADGGTGVTAVLFPVASPTVVDFRGGAPATYDTSSLSLDATFGRRWAIFFTGGSLFGLDAAAGIRERILEEGGGHTTFGNAHRIAPVSGAALFDLPGGDRPLPDYRALGYRAATRATPAWGGQGRIGAGSGATVAKYLGRRFAAPGGLGSASRCVPPHGSVAVLAVANSVGAIRNPSNGKWLAAARVPGRGLVGPPERPVRRAPGGRGSAGTNLLLTVTDATVTRNELQRIAVLAGTGVARCVIPSSTATDGDVTFAVSTREPSRARPDRYPGARADALGMAAANLVVTALARAVAGRRR